MDNCFALRARWVLPVEGAPIRDGFVSIVEGRIAAVGSGRPDGGRVEDLGDAVLLPGLVNAHTHLEFSDLAAPLGTPGMSLPEWIRLVIGQRKRGDRDAAAAVAAGLAESGAGGATAIGDIATSTAMPASTATVVPFQESIGFSAARVDSALADVERRFLASGPGAGLSPHAPYTVHPQLLARIVSLATEHGAPTAMHLAESREELQLLASGEGEFRELLEERSMWDGAAIAAGTRPLDYLRLLAEAPRAVVVHGNYLDAEEIEFIGGRRERMSVVYCPRTHAFFRHEPYPLAAMRAAGVRVALGTDSRASNPDLSLLAELRFAGRRHPDVAPAAWVRMATLDGAEALGLGATHGSLAAGKRADLIAVRWTGAEPHDAVLGDGELIGIWFGMCHWRPASANACATTVPASANDR